MRRRDFLKTSAAAVLATGLVAVGDAGQLAAPAEPSPLDDLPEQLQRTRVASVWAGALVPQLPKLPRPKLFYGPGGKLTVVTGEAKYRSRLHAYRVFGTPHETWRLVFGQLFPQCDDGTRLLTGTLASDSGEYAHFGVHDGRLWSVFLRGPHRAPHWGGPALLQSVPDTLWSQRLAQSFTRLAAGFDVVGPPPAGDVSVVALDVDAPLLHREARY